MCANILRVYELELSRRNLRHSCSTWAFLSLMRFDHFNSFVFFISGWFDFAYKGNPEDESLAFRNDYTAQYGLFGIDFETPEGIVRTGYSGWAVANSAHPNAYLSIHGSRVTAIISAVACILTAVTYLHSKKAPAEASVYIMGRCAWLATLDLALNLTTLGLWSITA